MKTKAPFWQRHENDWRWGFLKFVDFDYKMITHYTFFDLHITYTKKGMAHVSLYKATQYDHRRMRKWHKIDQASLTIEQNAYKINDNDRKRFELHLDTPIKKMNDWNSNEYWEFFQNEGTRIARDTLNWTISGKFIVKRKIN